MISKRDASLYHRIRQQQIPGDSSPNLPSMSVCLSLYLYLYPTLRPSLSHIEVRYDNPTGGKESQEQARVREP